MAPFPADGNGREPKSAPRKREYAQRVRDWTYDRTPNDSVDDLNGLYLFVSWLVAVGVTFAALSVDSITGESPCYLCWLQRLFMFPLAIILGIAAYRLDAGVKVYALPLAGFGGVVAGVHTLSYLGPGQNLVKPCAQADPPCSGDPIMILAGLPSPLIFLLCFMLIGGLLALCRFVER